MKRLILVSALFSAAAFAQQADVTGPELLSGNADSTLQQVARDAKASGKKLVISAPSYWHDLVLEQVRKGAGDVQIEMRDSFAEAVMIRAADGAAAAPAEPEAAPVVEPAPVAEAAPTPAPAPVPAPVAKPEPTPAPVAATPKPAAPAPTPAPEPERPAVAAATPPPAAPEQTPPPVAEATPRAAATPTPAVAAPARPAPAPAAAPTPAPVAATAKPTPAPAAATASRDSTAAEAESIKRRLEKSLNRGEAVTATLSPTELEPGDVLYVQGPVRGVLRRASRGNSLFWLEGELDLMRVELKELAGSRYQVMERVRETDNPRLRATREADRALFTAAKPTAHAEERTQLEQRYNAGAQIVEEIAVQALRVKDILYVGEDLIVVVRLNGKSLERYFLVGNIDLGRSEVIKDGANKYKVLATMR